MKILSAEHYVSPRSRPITPAEDLVRDLSYQIKEAIPENVFAFNMVAAMMACLLPLEPITLIPVPDRTGNTAANKMLCNCIKARLAHRSAPIVMVKDVLTRTQTVESQCERHRAGIKPLTVEEHHIVRIPGKGVNALLQTFFVDNVITSGNTMKACQRVIPVGDILVFADAYDGLKGRKGDYNEIG